MQELVQSALDAMERRDWDRLRPILHPYLRWTAADGSLLRGRLKVLAMLEASPTPAPPSEYELRDGQIYRWISEIDIDSDAGAGGGPFVP